jgi:hypothetical protein
MLGVNVHVNQIVDSTNNDNEELIEGESLNINKCNLKDKNLEIDNSNNSKDFNNNDTKAINNLKIVNNNEDIPKKNGNCERNRSKSKNKSRSLSKNKDKNNEIKKRIRELIEKYSNDIKNMTLNQSMSFLLQKKEFTDDMNNYLQYFKTLIEAKRNAISEEYENNYLIYRQVLTRILKDKLGLIFNARNKKPLFLSKLNYDFSKYNKTSLVNDYSTMVQTAKTKGESHYLTKLQSLSSIPKKKFSLSFAPVIQESITKTLNTMNY